MGVEPQLFPAYARAPMAPHKAAMATTSPVDATRFSMCRSATTSASSSPSRSPSPMAMASFHALPQSKQLSSCVDRDHAPKCELTAATMIRKPQQGQRRAEFRRLISQVFTPAKDRRQRHLHRAKAASEVAMCRRSRALLTEATAMYGPVAPASIDRDCELHVLQLQHMWLEAVLDMTELTSASPHNQGFSLSHFLSQFIDRQGISHVPCATDSPSMALARFEQVIDHQKLLPTRAQREFERLCSDTLMGTVSSATAVWTQRPASEVMNSLVVELTNTIAQEANLNADLLAVLGEFVEQMVFSRLAAACYHSSERSEMDAHWREQHAKCSRLWSWRDLELPECTENAFDATIAAFEGLPFVVPSSMLTVLVDAMSKLQMQAQDAWRLPASQLSAEFLQRVLAFVLSRCELPFLVSQLFVMTRFADPASDANYYLTWLRSAITHIMQQP